MTHFKFQPFLRYEWGLQLIATEYNILAAGQLVSVGDADAAVETSQRPTLATFTHVSYTDTTATSLCNLRRRHTHTHVQYRRSMYYSTEPTFG